MRNFTKRELDDIAKIEINLSKREEVEIVRRGEYVNVFIEHGSRPVHHWTVLPVRKLLRKKIELRNIYNPQHKNQYFAKIEDAFDIILEIFTK